MVSVQTMEPLVSYGNYSAVVWGGTKSGASGTNFSAAMVDGSTEDDVVPDDSGMTLSMNPGMKRSILLCVMCHNCRRGWSRVLSCSVADGGLSMSAACMTRITFLSDSSTASDWMTRHFVSPPFRMSNDAATYQLVTLVCAHESVQVVKNLHPELGHIFSRGVVTDFKLHECLAQQRRRPKTAFCRVCVAGGSDHCFEERV
jgi:hypothetical protein